MKDLQESQGILEDSALHLADQFDKTKVAAKEAGAALDLTAETGETLASHQEQLAKKAKRSIKSNDRVEKAETEQVKAIEEEVRVKRKYTRRKALQEKLEADGQPTEYKMKSEGPEEPVTVKVEGPVETEEPKRKPPSPFEMSVSDYIKKQLGLQEDFIEKYVSIMKDKRKQDEADKRKQGSLIERMQKSKNRAVSATGDTISSIGSGVKSTFGSLLQDQDLGDVLPGIVNLGKNIKKHWDEGKEARAEKKDRKEGAKIFKQDRNDELWKYAQGAEGIKDKTGAEQSKFVRKEEKALDKEDKARQEEKKGRDKEDRDREESKKDSKGILKMLDAIKQSMMLKMLFGVMGTALTGLLSLASSGFGLVGAVTGIGTAVAGMATTLGTKIAEMGVKMFNGIKELGGKIADKVKSIRGGDKPDVDGKGGKDAKKGGKGGPSGKGGAPAPEPPKKVEKIPSKTPTGEILKQGGKKAGVKAAVSTGAKVLLRAVPVAGWIAGALDLAYTAASAGWLGEDAKNFTDNATKKVGEFFSNAFSGSESDEDPINIKDFEPSDVSVTDEVDQAEHNLANAQRVEEINKEARRVAAYQAGAGGGGGNTVNYAPQQSMIVPSGFGHYGDSLPQRYGAQR